MEIDLDFAHLLLLNGYTEAFTCVYFMLSHIEQFVNCHKDGVNLLCTLVFIYLFIIYNTQLLIRSFAGFSCYFDFSVVY